MKNPAGEISELEEIRNRPKQKKNEFYGDIPILMQLEESAAAEDRPIDEKTMKIYKLIRENLLKIKKMKDVNITKAAEIIGIEADKAWNIFRKIQRKANKLYKKLKSDNVELLFTVEKVAEDSKGVNVMFQKDIPDTDKEIEDFSLKLTEIQINKINSIYSDSSPDKSPTK